MSLFEDDRYEWRETYFVLFDENKRPTADAVRGALSRLGKQYELGEIRSESDGGFIATELRSPDDYSAMDIVFVQGNDVAEQVKDLTKDLIKMTLTPEEHEKLDRLSQFGGRFDVFHFEQVVRESFGEADEFLDPGGLLLVLGVLSDLCDGVTVDPQTNSFL